MGEATVLRERLIGEGLDPGAWSNGPGDTLRLARPRLRQGHRRRLGFDHVRAGRRPDGAGRRRPPGAARAHRARRECRAGRRGVPGGAPAGRHAGGHRASRGRLVVRRHAQNRPHRLRTYPMTGTVRARAIDARPRSRGRGGIARCPGRRSMTVTPMRSSPRPIDSLQIGDSPRKSCRRRSWRSGTARTHSIRPSGRSRPGCIRSRAIARSIDFAPPAGGRRSCRCRRRRPRGSAFGGGRGARRRRARARARERHDRGRAPRRRARRTWRSRCSSCARPCRRRWRRCRRSNGWSSSWRTART